jgi:hypothetical protein
VNNKLRRIAVAAATAGCLTAGLTPAVASSRTSRPVARAASSAGSPLSALTPCSYLTLARVRGLFGNDRPFRRPSLTPGPGHQGICDYGTGNNITGESVVVRVIAPGYGIVPGSRLPNAESMYNEEWSAASTDDFTTHKGQARQFRGLGYEAFYDAEFAPPTGNGISVWWMSGFNELVFVGGIHVPGSQQTAIHNFIALAHEIQ